MFGSLYTFARHHWLTLAFLLGFIVDNLTLTRVDQLFDNIILLTYIILAMLSIILLYAGIAGRFGDSTNNFMRTKMPIVMQYAFGGLLSGMLIFYGRSGSIVDSWPFLLMIIAVIFGNETIKNREQRLVYNLVIFFVGLFAYTVLIVPVLLGKMNAIVFIGSGALALVIMHLFFGVLERVVPNFVEMQKRHVVFIIGIIYLSLNALYFTNLIPPIPLSLKHVGIYHSVLKYESGIYKLAYEKPAWWEWYRSSDETFRAETGDDVFCFASVFAPARLSTKIYHRWERYDEAAGVWVEYGRYPYSIAGGRGEGYRGYTQISNYTEGKWRCIVETERGQVLGKETFRIVREAPHELVTREE